MAFLLGRFVIMAKLLLHRFVIMVKLLIFVQTDFLREKTAPAS